MTWWWRYRSHGLELVTNTGRRHAERLDGRLSSRVGQPPPTACAIEQARNRRLHPCRAGGGPVPSCAVRQDRRQGIPRKGRPCSFRRAVRYLSGRWSQRADFQTMEFERSAVQATRQEGQFAHHLEAGHAEKTGKRRSFRRRPRAAAWHAVIVCSAIRRCSTRHRTDSSSGSSHFSHCAQKPDSSLLLRRSCAPLRSECIEWRGKAMSLRAHRRCALPRRGRSD